MGKWGLILMVVGLFVAVSASIFPTMLNTDEQTVFSNAEDYRVLVLGEDNAAGLSDVMMLASFHLETPSLSVVQIPRDTYLAYTSADYKKINGAVRSLGSERALCDFLGEAMGLPIDAYVSFDLTFLADAVDMLGGVEIEVPFDMDYDDPYQDLSIHLKAGKQTLSGKDAASFVRYRSGYLRGDLGRMDAQKLFLASFLKTFLKEGEREDLSRAAWLAAKYLRTDMPVGTMVALAGVLRRLSPDQLTLLTLPGEEVQSEYSGAWYYVASREGMNAVLRDVFGVDGAIFDPNGNFTNRKRKSFHQIYEKNIVPERYTAQELLDGQLTIENHK